MTDLTLDQEREQLRAQVAALQEAQKLQDKAAREQASRLEQSHQELHDRAQQLERSEDALRRQSRVLQAVLRSMSAGVVVAHETGKFLLFNPAAEQILGLGAAEVPAAEWSNYYGCFLPDNITPYPAEQLPLSRAMRGEEVGDTEVLIRNAKRPAGVWLCVTANPLRDELGSVRGGLAVFRDISLQKQSQRRLTAQHAVTRVLAEASSLTEAAPPILAAICDSIGWELGALWKVDRQLNVLRCVAVWQAPGAAYGAFEAMSRKLALTQGTGLPGTVWDTHEPVWFDNFSQEQDLPRAGLAWQAGLHRAFAFPILFGNEIVGVIEFFSQDRPRPDDELLCMLSALGRQIGQFTARRRAELDLAKSRERFELAMRGSGDGLWDWDLETNEVYFSPRWKSMLGYEDAEVRNSFADWEKLVHPDDFERTMNAIQLYFAGLTPTYDVELRMLHKDGTYRWIQARGVVLRDAEGKPYRMAGSQTDITERKQAEQDLSNSEALYHSLVETLPLNVFRKDVQGCFTFGNKRFCKTVGLSLAELIGKTDYDFYPAFLAEKYRQDDRRVIDHQKVVDEIEEHQQPDGKKSYVQVIKTPVCDSKGAVVGTQAIFWDVSERKRAEEAMLRAKEAAESANRAKSEFLANMSHEIRTPMNAIIGMTELVMDTSLTSEQRECLELVKKSADLLLTVINDVLDFSKVEAGKLDLDTVPFNLRDQLADTLNTLAPRAHKKGLELVYQVAPDVPDALLGDPVRLGQVLVNLVGNALKFTEQGEVVVEVETTSQTGKEAWLHLAVTDTGIGVPPDKCDSIFEPFVQADGSTTRKYGGTGLGLAIAKRLVEMMGGRIWLESQVGKGSIFHFTARLAVQKDPAARTQPAESATMRGMSVLVVDDNATNRRILEQTFTHWQMRPTLAESGPAALTALEHAAQIGEPFALVLIDANMPEMDGYSLAEKIRQDPELAATTLMMLTSGGPPAEGSRRRELGITSYLTKPIKQADLWKAILRALGMALAPDESAAPTSLQPAVGRPLRVLLAEDNLVNQKLAVRLLQKRGHSVVVANNGRDTLAAWQAQPFDVVLMDVQMPEMDGLETTAAMRRQEQGTGRHQPIIAMTAYAMKGDRERCLAAGMDRYISKPVRTQELFASIAEIVPESGPHPTVEVPVPARENPPPHTVIDEQEALNRVAGDRELLVELAEVFLEECPGLMRALQSAVASGDPARVKAAAHSLKGSIDNFAAPDAFQAALTLEMLGRDGNLAGVHEAWKILEQEIDRLKPVLASLGK